MNTLTFRAFFLLLSIPLASSGEEETTDVIPPERKLHIESIDVEIVDRISIDQPKLELTISAPETTPTKSVDNLPEKPHTTQLETIDIPVSQQDEAIAAVKVPIIPRSRPREFQLLFSEGTPISSQNIDISTRFAELQTRISRLGLLNLDVAGSLGSIMTPVGDSNVYAFGLGLSTGRTNGLRARADSKIRHLETYRFDEGIATKDYGGPTQFSYSLGFDWKVSQSPVLVGYRFEHMSNFNMFDSNPTLNSHNLTFAYSF